MSQPLILEDIIVSIETDEELKAGAAKIVSQIRPNWSLEQLNFRLFTDGITNKLIGVSQGSDESDTVLIRIYGAKSELMIDRKAEIRNMLMLSAGGFGGKLYACFKNGLAYEFIQGKTLTPETVRNPEIYRLVATAVANMHKGVKSKSNETPEPCLWKKILQFWELSPDGFPEDPEKDARYCTDIMSKEERKLEIDLMKETLEDCGNDVVFCHNDLLLGNVIVTPENKVYFIDFEYGDFNYQAFDIADHFCEFAGVDSKNMDYDKCYPDKEFQLKWLRFYLQTFRNDPDVSDDDVESLYKLVNKFALCARLFWGNWALVQSKISTLDFDFLGYAQQMLDEYKNKKNQFLNL